MKPTVLGLDLSLTATGLSDGVTTWLLPSRGKSGDDLATRGRRLSAIRSAVLLWARDVHLVVIEQPAYSRQTGHMHDRSGLWWLVVADLLERAVPVAEIAPSALKKYATGKGNAGKGAIVDATARRFPDVDTGSGDDNRCDALWLAAMGLEHLTGSGCVPAAHRAALQAVRWPAVHGHAGGSMAMQGRAGGVR